jgi:tetratricopeptide (TPR) repeat protein
MYKTSLMGIAAIIAVFLVSCSSAEKFKSREQKVDTVPVVVNKYGAYLAGRVAHLRKDFENASNYYKLAVEQVPGNKQMVNQLYLLLASQGKIDEAFKYAQNLAVEGEKVLFAHLVIAAKKMHDGDYHEVIRQTNKINNNVQDNLLVPVFKSWAYAGLGNKKKAKTELNKLKKEKEFSFLQKHSWYTCVYGILLNTPV